MEKQHRSIFLNAAYLAAASSCGELSSGRCISAFYAQTGRYSWLGVAVSCLIFGLGMAGILRLKKKTCAGSLPEMYTAVFGRTAGCAFIVLHAAFYVLCAYILAGTAAGMARLTMPVQHADIIGIIFAAAIALWLSGNNDRLKNAGGMCFVLMLCMMIAAAASGKLPAKNQMQFYVDLRLENEPWAAVLLGVIHASLAAGMCAAAAVRLFPAHLKPVRVFFVSLAAFGGMLVIGNGVFSMFPKEINALRYPFVVLTTCWGKAGYYIFALGRYAETIISMCGILCFLPGNRG